MKVRVLRNLGRQWPRLAEDEIADVSSETAEALIAKGLAVAVDGKGQPKEFKAVPPPAEITSPEQAEFNAVVEKVKHGKKNA